MVNICYSSTSSGRDAGGETGARRMRFVREPEPSLSVSFPNKVDNYELKIIRQPDEQQTQ